MPERSGDSNQPVNYDMKMLSMQQEQLISSLWRALPQQTINPMHSQLQNSDLYQGEIITFPINISHISVVSSSDIVTFAGRKSVNFLPNYIMSVSEDSISSWLITALRN